MQMGCGGSVKVERDPSFSHNKKKKIDYIISIAPDFDFWSVSRSGVRKSFTPFKQDKLKDALRINARKNKIKLELAGGGNLSSNDPNFFEELIPLKREILQVMYFNKYREIERTNGKSNFSISFIKSSKDLPEFSPEYVSLAAKYGTPYFAVQNLSFKKKPKKTKWLMLATMPPLAIMDLFVPDVDLDYFVIIADVERSKIVYFERRTINSQASLSNINAVLYDSFRIIARY